MRPSFPLVSWTEAGKHMHVLHNILPVLSLQRLNVCICDNHFTTDDAIVSMPDGHLHPNGNPLGLCRPRFDSLKWRKLRCTCICTPQRLANLYERMLVTKEYNRNNEYLKVHVEFCGRFSELHVIAKATDSFSTILVWIYEILHRLLVLMFEEQVAFYRVCQNYKTLAVP